MKLEDLLPKLEAMHQQAWHHSIEGQRILAEIRDLETGIKGELARARIKEEAAKDPRG
jgi:hypothetical protein